MRRALLCAALLITVSDPPARARGLTPMRGLPPTKDAHPAPPHDPREEALAARIREQQALPPHPPEAPLPWKRTEAQFLTDLPRAKIPLLTLRLHLEELWRAGTPEERRASIARLRAAAVALPDADGLWVVAAIDGFVEQQQQRQP